LALLQPQRQFTLIDSVAKTLRFVDHAAQLLGLTNVQSLHARVEALQLPPFDTVVTRAFAPLPRLLQWVTPLCDAHTRVLAMKGRWPPLPDADDAGALPRGWRLEQVQEVKVPGLDAARHILTLRRVT
jgi:16S rRNA (guanine527-N7)-methyltransferase